MDADNTAAAPSGSEKRPDVRTAFIAGPDFGPTAVRYEVVGDLAVYQRDIVLGTVAEVEAEARLIRLEPTLARRDAVARLAVIRGSRYRWGGVVAWDIDPSIPAPQAAEVRRAIAHWESATILAFPERPTRDPRALNWITFRSHPDRCMSRVGRLPQSPGQQFVDLAPDCRCGEIAHEIGHAVGLWHEQSRSDRDFFISINWNAIELGCEHNFDPAAHVDGQDVGPYDYGSIMHYAPRDCGVPDPVTGIPAVVITPTQPLPPGVVVGQRDGLSPGDIANVNRIYRCDSLARRMRVLRRQMDALWDELYSDPPPPENRQQEIREELRDLHSQWEALVQESSQLGCSEFVG